MKFLIFKISKQKIPFLILKSRNPKEAYSLFQDLDVKILAEGEYYEIVTFNRDDAIMNSLKKS